MLTCCVFPVLPPACVYLSEASRLLAKEVVRGCESVGRGGLGRSSFQ